jgi:hypothetical protein
MDIDAPFELHIRPANAFQKVALMASWFGH